MGAYSSTRIISQQEAQAALGAATYRRIEEGFVRLVSGGLSSSSGGQGGAGAPPKGAALHVDRKTFQRHVLEAFPYTPALVSDALFDAFDMSTQGKTLSAADFACGVAILLHGQPEWRVRLLFSLLDPMAAGVVTLPEVIRLMNAVHGRDNDELAQAFPVAMRGLFGDLARPQDLDMAEFAARITRNPAAMEILLDWAVQLAKRVLQEPSPRLMALDRKYNPEKDLRLIAKQYGVPLAEMDSLARMFQYLCKEGRSTAGAGGGAGGGGGRGMGCDVWCHKLLRRYMAPPLSKRLFALLLANPQHHGGSDALSLVEFASFICLMCRGPLTQRLRLLFQVFDADGDGFLSRSELGDALTWLVRHRGYREEVRQKALGGAAGGGATNIGTSTRQQPPPQTSALALSRSTSREEGTAAAADVVPMSHTRIVLQEASSGNSSNNNRQQPEEVTQQDEQEGEEEERGRRRAGSHAAQEEPSTTITETVNQALDALLPPSYSPSGAAILTTATEGGDDASSFPSSMLPPPQSWSLMQWREWMTEQRPASQFESYGPRQQILRDLAFMASAELGLRPASLLEEREFVYELFKQFTDEVRPAPSSEGGGGANNLYRRGVAGTAWCLITRTWWDSWRAFVSPKSLAVPEAPSPGPIDNTDLLLRKESRELQPGLHLGEDFQILPPRLWFLLQAWYGGGPTIERQVVDMGGDGGVDLEYYPLCIRWTTCDTSGKPRRFEREVLFSRYGKVEALLTQLCQSIDADPQNAKLWLVADPADRDVPKERHLMEAAAGSTLEAAGVRADRGDLVVLELVMENELWPRTLLMEREREKREQERQQQQQQQQHHHRASSGAGSTFLPLNDEASIAAGILDESQGLVGLHNLGNTCFINAPLQCLSHTPVLTEYFLAKVYLHDVNITNKLGTQGRLAQLYYQLLQDLWQSRKKCVNPRAIKDLIMTNGIFAGFEQHDAQELLAYLLSTLSEDLNRVVEKLYIEQPDSDGRPDHELADIWWRNHFKRELSIIVALFTGQFKVVNTCGECGYASARFETFTVLPLQIPEETHRSVMVLYVAADQEARPPLRVCTRVPKTGLVRDVKEALLELLAEEGITATAGRKGSRLREEDLVMVDVHKSFIFSVVSEERALVGLRDLEVMAGAGGAPSSSCPLLYCYEVETLNPLPTEAAAGSPGGHHNNRHHITTTCATRLPAVPAAMVPTEDGEEGEEDEEAGGEATRRSSSRRRKPVIVVGEKGRSAGAGSKGGPESEALDDEESGEEEGDGGERMKTRRRRRRRQQQGEGVNGGGTLQPPSPVKEEKDEGGGAEEAVAAGQEEEGEDHKLKEDEGATVAAGDGGQTAEAEEDGQQQQREEDEEEAASPQPLQRAPAAGSSSSSSSSSSSKDGGVGPLPPRPRHNQHVVDDVYHTVRQRRAEFFYVAVLHRVLERSPVYFMNPFELHDFGIPLLYRVRRPPLEDPTSWTTTSSSPSHHSSSGSKPSSSSSSPVPLTGFRLYNKLYSRLRRLLINHPRGLGNTTPRGAPPPPPSTSSSISRVVGGGSDGSGCQEDCSRPRTSSRNGGRHRMPEVRSMNDMYDIRKDVEGAAVREQLDVASGPSPSPHHHLQQHGGPSSAVGNGNGGPRDDTAVPTTPRGGGNGGGGGTTTPRAAAAAAAASSKGLPVGLKPSSLVDEDVCGGEVPMPWGFRLRHVTPNGAACSRCPWLKGCCGCLIPVSEDYIVDLKEGDAIAVDWHMSIFKECFNFGAAMAVEQHRSVQENSKRVSEGLSLEQCLDAYTQEERLKDEVYCSKCREHRTNALRKEEIWRLPPILIVHLKRFHFTTQSRRKLHTLVRFPLDNLNLYPYLAQRDAGGEAGGGMTEDTSQYRLYGVIHHVGAMTVGHYVASIKSEHDGKWYCFNDSRVDEVSESDLVNASAYILFYERKDMANLRFSDLNPRLGLLGHDREQHPSSSQAGGEEGGAQPRREGGAPPPMTAEELDRFLRRRDGRGCTVQ